MAVKNESSLKGNVKRKLPSESSNCDSADGSCCCGICFSSSGEKWRRPARRGCVVFIVFLALLLDSLLLTCMVPIIPNYLRDSATGEEPTEPHTPPIRPATTSFPGGANQSFQVSLMAPYNQEVAVKIFLNKVHLRHPLFRKSTASPSVANKTYTKENTKISLLFASKTLVQALTNLIVGPLTERIGYSVPMFSGFIVLLLSTIAFAFGNTYELLFAARAFQGVGTAFSTTSGMGLLASLYPDQTERTVAQTKAFSGLALGVLCKLEMD
ncbi:hypothetical protein RRG08_005498 [Elysia crispata]|uniref:Major facilitator superfamily (MFS) profile domain-containing protein n=1 Tax=Elysia crispata TaxID=231223 RepID=A0AAE0Y2H2_9GAST|nr:hypothetical protein RRG08_005498 [Elysia crispata]